ncbi:MAG: hypothetical protein U5L03_01315 [Burkholderiaceae bacterium]|nr:hypothetical protein [Burkholderiaceae bacterium]
MSDARLSVLRRSLLNGAAAVPLAALGGCSREAAAPAVTAAGDVLRAGSPTIPPSIKLTPQTVVVKDGARAFKGRAADRRTLRLDAAAAEQVRAGSVVVLSDVGVFKAQAVRREGGELFVAPEPCAINELIRDGEVNFNGLRIDPRAARLQTALAPRASTALAAAALDWLVPPAHAASADRYTGQLGDYEVDAGYAGSDGALRFDGRFHRDSHGMKIDVKLDGQLSGFSIGGRIAVADGRARNLNLLLNDLAGQVELTARAGRGAKGEFKGEELIVTPIEESWPVVIDGIPFVLRLKCALLVNDGLTNVDAFVEMKTGVKFRSERTGFDMRLPGEPNKVEHTPVGSLQFEDFQFHKADGVGLGPQTLLAAFQFPRLGFGLGIEHVFAGSFIDLVTAANTTLAGSMAPVPCRRSQLTLTGSVGVDGKFLLWEKSTKLPVWTQEFVRTVPDVKACQIAAGK